jgi:histidine ammonia-lyase
VTSAEDPVPSLRIEEPSALTAAAILRLARGELSLDLDENLLRGLDTRRAALLAALARGGPVYGVNTGMGALSQHRLDESAQSRHQEALLVARSAGGPPWLTAEEVRAVLGVRLRTFLNGDAGVGARLCRRIVEVIDSGITPAVPRTSTGVAGEIIGLAHLGAALVGTGEVIGVEGEAVPAGPVLDAGGLARLRLGPKEGVALIEGVPMATALAILTSARARGLLRQELLVLAAEFALTNAARDVFDARLGRGDVELTRLTATLRELAGSAHQPRALQPPVSFRASAQVLAHLLRSLTALDAAIERAMAGVTDSPAFLPDRAGEGNAFVGSAGFYGYDLAANLHALTVALIGVAELGAARLHRLLDPAVSGRTAQLSVDPGPQTGLSPVHKRAVGVTHQLRRQALPASLGPVETSAGQEDVQAFALEAAEAARAATIGAREVLACELLAIHQVRCLGATMPSDAGRELITALDAVAALLPADPGDRPFGRDVETLRRLLGAGWPA